MKKKFQLKDEDKALFRQSTQGTHKLVQDTLFHPTSLYKDESQAHIKKHKYSSSGSDKKKYSEEKNHSHYFSHLLQTNLPDEGPTRYIRKGENPHELKRLRRGDYIPDITLDLHGATLHQAKEELARLIIYCQRESFFCANVVHGHGKGILKRQIPLWLTQHPDVIAFHEAPKRFGENAALLVLIEQLP